MASWATHQAAPVHARAYSRLGSQLRDGSEPCGFRRAEVHSYWDYLTENPDEGAAFDRAMRELTGIDLAAMSRAYPWPDDGVICDVAGGSGQLLAAILGRHPRARGLLLDTPEVIAAAEAFLNSRGLLDRVECRPGDLTGDLESKADLYVLKWTLHSWSDESCREILGQVRATMPEGARVLVIDQHLLPSRPNSITPLTDIHMLVTCDGGRERSPEEIADLMRDAGLQPGRVRHAGLQMLVEGTAA